MSRLRVVTDSACDLPAELLAKHGIDIVPLDVRLGDDGPEVMRDLTPEQFWDKCAKSASLPETSAPSPGAFRDAFSAAADDGCEGVLCVNISGALSGTLLAARAGAEEVADRIPVRVIDSRMGSVGEGLVVLEAARLADTGATLDEAADAVAATVPGMRLFGTLDTLDNLRRGGRIGAAQKLLGSVLSIKPVIQVVDGAVEPESRQRTRARSLQYLVAKVKEAGELSSFGILHAMAPDVEEFAEMLAPIYPADRTIVGIIGPVIGTHSGLGAIGVAFQLALGDQSDPPGSEH